MAGGGDYLPFGPIDSGGTDFDDAGVFGTSHYNFQGLRCSERELRLGAVHLMALIARARSTRKPS
jgi:hypothetical protein